MQLELTHEEAVTLAAALETHLTGLRRVLAATSGRDLQHAIRLDFDRLEDLQARVARLVEQAGGGAWR